MMNWRRIAIANARSRIAAWSIYVYRAEVDKDAKRVEYGQLRLGNAQRRLRSLLRP